MLKLEIFRQGTTFPLASLLFVAAILFLPPPSASDQHLATISGTVTSVVVATSWDHKVTLYSHERIAETQADREGRFVFSDQPPGTYDVTVTDKRMIFGSTIVTVKLNGKDVGPISLILTRVYYPTGPDVECGREFWRTYDLGTPSDGIVRGHLSFDDFHRPRWLKGWASLELISLDGQGHRISAHPNAHGEFEFRHVPAGRYGFSAYRRGWYREGGIIWITAADTTAVRIRLYRRGHPAVCS